MRPVTRCLVLCALSALAACGDGEESPATQAQLEGKVLQGSVSDDMLPYDTVRSQPPLAAPKELEDGDKDKPESDSDEASEAEGA